MASHKQDRMEYYERIASSLRTVVNSLADGRAELTVDTCGNHATFEILPSNPESAEVHGEVLPHMVTLCLGAGAYREFWHTGGNIIRDMASEREIAVLCEAVIKRGADEIKYCDPQGRISAVKTVVLLEDGRKVGFSKGPGIKGLFRRYKTVIRHYEPY